MPKLPGRNQLLEAAPFGGIFVASVLVLLGGAWYFLRLGQPPLDIPVADSVGSVRSSTDVSSNTSAGIKQSSPSALIEQLSLVPMAQRVTHLEQLIQGQGRQGQERHQARFMAAADAVAQNNGQRAIALLNGLETDYPVVASEILVLRAQAQRQIGQTDQANQTWQTLIEKHGSDPASVEGLFALNLQDSKYGDQALERFPAHPLSVAIALQRLKQQPDRLDLLRLVARHGLHLPDLKTYLKRLVDKHGKHLTPEDWHAVGFAYWEKLTYNEAGQAYARAPRSSLNLYRAARGLQLGDEKKAAITAYQKVVAAYPASKEAAQAYLKLGELVDPPEQRLSYLSQGMQLAQSQGRSHLVADGLLTQANLEKRLNRPQAQAKTEQMLLEMHRDSQAATNLRWRQARAAANAKNYRVAHELAWAAAQNRPKATLAPKAAFWSVLWAAKAGDTNHQADAFPFLWTQHPDSYYTWRSGSLSGWSVGDFQTVRDLAPQPNWPSQKLPLAAGSPAIQTLYQMGQSQQAWKRWLVEFETREQPTIPEQQTDGLIRIGVGEYLDGIFMLNNLDDRLEEEPEFEAQVRQWRSHPGFWYALYPLAYYPETAGWAQQVNLNPLLALGLMRQESRFQSTIKSSVGAVGLMQIMPETGRYIAQNLGAETFDLERPQDNLQFGTWYLDEVHQTYGNNSILAIASYNAGPGNVAKWVERYSDLPPDEFIDAIPFSETRQYVTAVLENHWNYLRLYDPQFQNLLPKALP
ncbi:MAG: transglycosylase SLT domain-containing protein [Cyanobacteria bacterium P01_F01_bin.42]